MNLKLILFLLGILLCLPEIHGRTTNNSVRNSEQFKNEKEDPAQKLLREHSVNVNGAQRFITSMLPSLQMPTFSFMRDVRPSNLNNDEENLNRNEENVEVRETSTPSFYDDNEYDTGDGDHYYDYIDPDRRKNRNDVDNNDDDNHIEYVDQDQDEDVERIYTTPNRRGRSVQVNIPSMSGMSTGIGTLVQNTMNAFSGMADQKMRLLMNMSSSAGQMVGDTTSSISSVLSAVSSLSGGIGIGITQFDETLTMEELRLVENTKAALANFLNDLATMSSGSARSFNNNPEEAAKFIAAQNNLIDVTRESYVQIFNDTTRAIRQLARQMSTDPTPVAESSPSSFLTRLLRSTSDSIRVMANLTRNLSNAIELSGRVRDPQALRNDLQNGAEHIRNTTSRLREYQRQNVRQILRRNKRRRDVRRRTQTLRRRRTRRRGRRPARRRQQQNRRRRRRTNALRNRRRNTRRRRNRNRSRRRLAKRRNNRRRRRRQQRRRQNKIYRRRRRLRRIRRPRRRQSFRGRPVRFSLPIAGNTSLPKMFEPIELNKNVDEIVEKREEIQNKKEVLENKNKLINEDEKEIKKEKEEFNIIQSEHVIVKKEKPHEPKSEKNSEQKSKRKERQQRHQRLHIEKDRRTKSKE